MLITLLFTFPPLFLHLYLKLNQIRLMAKSSKARQCNMKKIPTLHNVNPSHGFPLLPETTKRPLSTPITILLWQCGLIPLLTTTLQPNTITSKIPRSTTNNHHLDFERPRFNSSLILHIHRGEGQPKCQGRTLRFEFPQNIESDKSHEQILHEIVKF